MVASQCSSDAFAQLQRDMSGLIVSKNAVVDGLNRLFVMKGCDCVAHTLVVHSHWHMAWILTQGWLSAQAVAGTAYTVSWVRIITPRFT